MLPHEYLPWGTVYWHFSIWKKDETLEKIHDNLVKDCSSSGGKKNHIQPQIFSIVSRVKRSNINKHVFKLLPKRRIVERTLSWLSRYRRLSKDYEYDTSSEEAFVHLAMIRVMLLKIEKEYV